MVLVDTSVWVDHFRFGDVVLAGHLSEGNVLTHPFVLGELVCGNLQNRKAMLEDLYALPAALVATDAEVVRLIEGRRLWGRGLGWIDVHLLASALLSHCEFRTLDKRLKRAAGELGLS